jgi:hypothetical protein
MVFVAGPDGAAAAVVTAAAAEQRESRGGASVPTGSALPISQVPEEAESSCASATAFRASTEAAAMNVVAGCSVAAGRTLARVQKRSANTCTRRLAFVGGADTGAGRDEGCCTTAPAGGATGLDALPVLATDPAP